MHAGWPGVIRIAGPALLLAIGGCGSPSQPANTVAPDTPFRTGLWRVETKTKPPVANGATLIMLRGVMPEDKTDTYCGVPMVTDLSNVTRRIKSVYDTDCDAEPPVLADGEISGQISCAPFEQGGAVMKASIAFGGDYSEDELDARVTVNIRGTRPTGATDLVTIHGRKTATRLGDC